MIKIKSTVNKIKINMIYKHCLNNVVIIKEKGFLKSDNIK